MTEFLSTKFEGLPPGQLLVAGLQWLESAAARVTNDVDFGRAAIDAAIGQALIDAAQVSHYVSTNLTVGYGGADA